MNGLALTFANVGYGEAMLLAAADPSRKDGVFTMLIDGGGNTPAEFAGSTSGRAPFADFIQKRQIPHLDLAVCTHIHEDHISGMVPVLQDLAPDAFWQTLPGDYFRKMRELSEDLLERPDGKKYIRSLNDYRKLCGMLAERGTKIPDPEDLPEVFRPFEGLTISVIGPSAAKREALRACMVRIYDGADPAELPAAISRADASMNNFSLMLMIEYAGRRILLPGDTNREGYGDVTADLSADIFKVGHHGQKDGISRELFRRIRPSYVVCCASSDRRYNSAAPEILAMMQEEGAALTFSDCPEVLPFTEGLMPHSTLTFTITPDGEISYRYE